MGVPAAALGGPAGAGATILEAQHSANQQRKQRKQQAAQQPGTGTPPPGPAPRPRGRSSTRGPSTRVFDRKVQGLAGKANGGIILAEYVTGVFLIGTSIFTKGPDKGYLDTMSQILIRLTALSAIFFVLFLVSGSGKAGKAAAWFGFLIDLGILFHAVSEQEIGNLASIFKGDAINVDETTVAKSTSVDEPTPTQLPS